MTTKKHTLNFLKDKLNEFEAKKMHIENLLTSTEADIAFLEKELALSSKDLTKTKNKLKILKNNKPTIQLSLDMHKECISCIKLMIMKRKLQIVSIRLAILAIIVFNILMVDSIWDVFIILIGFGFSSLITFFEENQ